ncbi:UDP-N-acetylmuramoyl-tripeptide--D-alanyl-D-alanine ligase [Ruminiclostridium sufflavum DSM 19573]|uniref:UDP-N-acetylmuramoyl-tripeptide--D-alanyl-D-alanine ligase n=1 Tax=Ruminiclostridium sufflavum DSM 19573 TaxID=1121337 RepID=A0A318XLX4_9FIRM|nr:UDP-N-acetylmuramoyl-tripeptide--D-alanyl-D-alanine ligase [Ruminiclostridium sufflavum]PYG88437.1 UDP-N-acetylmuramoyl-tripeptide--D-alanyl-D-alanine ligase [Ruminiclostridium sufflavum DSM 19573]
MISFDCAELVRAVNGKLLWGKAEQVFSGVTTDSRRVAEGNLFIPLAGERFDGHDYIEQCFSSGAAVCLTERTIPQKDNAAAVLVDDTARALRDLAAWHRKKHAIPVVGITGSVGKTSTKDMIACVLSKKYDVLKTQGNFNNEIGLPLTILNLNDRHEAAVIEMGMSGFGEISRLTAIAQPQIAVITNIGVSHIEKLGSRQGILKAKLEIFEGLKPGGLAVLNGDDPLLKGLEESLEYKTVYYGMNSGLDYVAEGYESLGEAGTSFSIRLGEKLFKVFLPVPGIHNVYNALAAIAVGIEMNIPMDTIVEGIGAFSPGNMRQNIIAFKGIKIINDAYNASPQSMQAAINVLEELCSKTRGIAVLGDMLEMGDMSEELHYEVGSFIKDKKIDYLITIGNASQNIMQAAADSGKKAITLRHFNTNGEALEYILSIIRQGDYVLIKGSRGMKMEQITEGIMNSGVMIP